MERFWDKVDVQGPDDCWLWTACTSWNGYGKIRIDGKDLRAHRLMYELEVGPIPSDKIVRHTCDTPACVNPKHLLLGTHKENSQDQVERGRSYKGSKNPNAVLNEEKVLQIRQLFDTEGKSAVDLAQLFAINLWIIKKVVYRQQWRHI